MIRARSTNDLELKIKADKRDYLVGESVFLEMSLLNTGNDGIRIARFARVPSDDPIKNNFEVFVYDADGGRITRLSHVMTGRALYYPEILSIAPGETYRESIQLAGTFKRKNGGKKLKPQALWSLGEDPELYVSEYRTMAAGAFRVEVIYRVTAQHLISLSEAERAAVWQGELQSNTVEFLIK